MKKFIFLAAAAALALVSCGKLATDSSESSPYPDKDQNCSLHINFGSDLSTKVSAQTLTNEKTIQNVQIFVFRAGTGADAGMLDIAASYGFDTPLNVSAGNYTTPSAIKCAAGEREVWAVVNDSEDRTAVNGGVATLSDFKALTHELKNSSSVKLFMTGAKSATLTPGANTLTIPVKRLCASVILNSVRNDFSSPAYQKADMFRIEDCYLLNVPAIVNFGGTLEPSTITAAGWYGKTAAEASAPAKDLVFDDGGAGTVVNYGSTNTTAHTFYSYPNNCAASTDAVWSTRATLLVLEASINYGGVWTKYYYPVTIAGGLQSNKQYKVDVTVHRPGSTDPNRPVTFSDLTPTVTVTDWESGETYTQEI